MYRLRRFINRKWQSLLEWLDETGFGGPLREMVGWLVAQATLKTGKKGINLFQFLWVVLVFLVTVSEGWNVIVGVVMILAGIFLFPEVRGIPRRLVRPWVQRLIRPDQVVWNPKPRLHWPKPSDAQYCDTRRSRKPHWRRRRRR